MVKYKLHFLNGKIFETTDVSKQDLSLSTFELLVKYSSRRLQCSINLHEEENKELIYAKIMKNRPCCVTCSSKRTEEKYISLDSSLETIINEHELTSGEPEKDFSIDGKDIQIYYPITIKISNYRICG